MNGSTPVHARAAAVEQLAQSVRAFGEQQSGNLASAQTALAKQVQRTDGEMQSRRRDLEQARRAAAAAEAALAACRENCGGLAQAVAAARRQVSAAEQSLARARQAAELLQQASTKLASTSRKAEHSNAEHGRAAVAACTELAERLRSFLRHAAGTVEVMASVAHAGSQAGLAMPPQSFLAAPAAETTIAARAESDAQDQIQLWADSEKIRGERQAGNVDRPT